MLALVWMICAASNIALATSNVIKPSGKITISPSVVDLDSNVTFYTVSCRLEDAQDGLDSSSLFIELQNERIKSEILNESTIVAVQQVNGAVLEKCGVRKYICYSGGSGLDVARVTVGWIPAKILPAEIRCISEDLRDLRCEVPIKRPCDLETSYKMMMNYRFGSSLCSVEVVGGSLVKPDQAPKTVPGAFSFKAWHGKLATFDVYWEHIPKYLQNGPGFRYNVSAVSDTGQTFHPVQSPATSPVATFENMNNAHYRVLISCYNDEGSVENHNELHVFPPNPSHQPKIKRVLNSAHFELSWHAPTHQQDLTSYTVMYCNYTSANVCQDSIRFAVVPPNTTNLRISSTPTLNFAVSANFAHFSTPLSWQECIVSPADVGIGQPKFDVIDVRGDSLVLLFNNGCIERSFYDRMRLLVWKGSEVVLRADFEPYRDRFAVQGLSPGTEYAIQVLAYDGLGMVQHTRTVVTKDVNDNLLKAIFYISCGMLMALTIFTTAARRVRKVFDIRVETPLQLTVSKQFPNETTLQPHSKDDDQDNNSVLVQLTSKTESNDLDT
ncbi:hypothetical protein pipiens_005550 [Culex pipiens pipiens]|uniref:Fibronectin type-III domain-containing protein n=1 Tax=Culex pipiens pipiens TaxID=38569 RepID=A0ABD1DW03_CULPP